MLTKIDVDNLQGSTLSLPLQDTSAGYNVRSVEGLDPVKATVVSANFAQLDGSQQQGARRENRNIILRVGIEPYSGGATVRSLRTNLYTYFMPKSFVQLKFYEDDVLTASIMGQVESFENPLFSKDPEVAVSIICFDPSFLDPSLTTVAGNTVTGSTEQTIAYSGTIETGVIFRMTANRTMTGFTIRNRRPDGSESIVLDSTYSILSGDVIVVSTISKNKYATITRAGVTSSIMYTLSSAAKWGMLYPGNNYFRVVAAGAAVPFTIEYTAKYGGL